MEGDRGDVKENGTAEANCPRLESSTEKIISENAENVCDPLLSQPDEANLTPVEFFVVHNKNKHKVNFFLEKTVSDLKKHLQNILGNYIIFLLFSCPDIPYRQCKSVIKSLCLRHCRPPVILSVLKGKLLNSNSLNLL